MAEEMDNLLTQRGLTQRRKEAKDYWGRRTVMEGEIASLALLARNNMGFEGDCFGESALAMTWGSRGMLSARESVR